MLELLKNESTVKNTFNGAKTYSTSNSECLDLFFRAGAMRNASSEDIAAAVRRAYAEDPVRTMKIIFFARDIRGGLGERRFFREAVKLLAKEDPDAVLRNAEYFCEYGRYDDLCALLGTPCEQKAVEIIKHLSIDTKQYDKFMSHEGVVARTDYVGSSAQGDYKEIS